MADTTITFRTVSGSVYRMSRGRGARITRVWAREPILTPGGLLSSARIDGSRVDTIIQAPAVGLPFVAVVDGHRFTTSVVAEVK